MNSACITRLTIAIVCGLPPSGCGFGKASSKVSQPTAPIIGEPSFVRVQTGKVGLAQGAADPFSQPEKLTPDDGKRFIAVGFPIGPTQTLALDDYEVLDIEDDPQIPFAVGGEGPEAPQFFYDTEDFSRRVTLTKGTEEKTVVQGSADDPLLISWETPSPVVLLLYEIPTSMKTVTLRHGTRTFKLEPDAGLIDGKPGTAK